MNLLKKVSLSTLMFVTVFGMGFGNFVPKAHAALATGDLVKGPNSDAVYYINGSTKHVFPDKKTYMTWYSNFDAVKKVAVSELDMYPTGAAVGYRPGTKLITHPNTAKVFAVEPMGVIRWIPDEATAVALYGANWGKMVQDVHELTFGNYTIGSDMTSAAPAKGTVLQKTGDATIYYYDGTNIRPFANSAAFDANNLNYDNIVKVASLGTWTVGSSITGAESFATIAGVGTGTINNVPAGTLTVALSPNTPASGIAVAGAARLPFTAIRLTTGSNPVTIDSLTVKRGGLAQDGSIVSVDVLDGTTMIPFDQNSKTFNSEHEATFNKDIVIPANTSKDILLSANMLSTIGGGYDGEVPALGLSKITLLGGSTMNGTLPIFGNYMTVNSTITIGSATVSRGSYTNATSTNLEVGRKDYTFSSFQILAGSAEDVTFSQVALYNNGTATMDTDLTNFRLYRDGTQIAVGTVSDRYVNFAFSPILIPKGQTFQFQVKADVESGSARSVILGVYRPTDLLVKGMTYGYNITPTYTGTGSSWTSATVYGKPVLSDNSFTIGNGTLTVERSSTVGSGNITIGNDQVLGAFKLTVKGEPIEISAATLTVASSTSGTIIEDALRSVRLVNSAGATVAGPTDITNNALTVAWTDTFTAPVGESVYKVIGNLATNGGWSTNDTITVTFAASSMTAQGETTGNAITGVPAASTSANQQTVKAAKLQVSRNTVPATQNVVLGKQDLTLGSWSFDASDSGEDVRVTSVAFRALSANDAQNTIVSNLTLFVDGVAQSPIVEPNSTAAASVSTSTFALDNAIVITKGAKKTITLEGDILSSSSNPDSIAYGLTDTSTTNNSVVAYGVGTGNRASVTMNADDGATFTVQTAGTVTINTTSTLSPALVRAGATGVTFGSVKFDAINEDLDLDNLTIFVSDGGVTGTATGNYQDTTMVYLYDGATLVASASIPSNGKYQWTFANGTLTVPADGSKTLTIKSDIATISSTSDNNPGTPAADIAFGFGGADGIQFTGNASNTVAAETYNGSTTTGMVLHKALPTVTLATSGNRLGSASSMINGASDIYAFKVSADASGNEVLLYRASFEVSTGGGQDTTVTNCYLKDDNGNTIGAAVTPTEGAGAEPNRMTYTFNNPDFNLGNAKEALSVAAGSSETYTLNCTVANAGTGDYISVSLLGDAASSTPAASHGTPAASNANNADSWTYFSGNGNFIWSDNFKNRGISTEGTNATSYGQWYNGYLVSGLGTTATTTAYTLGWSS